MPRGYKQLSQEERDRISALRAGGQSVREIARRLRRDPGTLSRELKRNGVIWSSGFEYLPHQAQQRAEYRKAVGHERQRLREPGLRNYATRMLFRGWSPERIAGRWKKHGNDPISHEAIYQWIYAERRNLIPLLVRSHKRRRRHRGRSSRLAIAIPSRIPISQRPKAIELRADAGHWEGDTMVSSKSRAALQVLVERKTRYTRIMMLRLKNSASVRRSISIALCRYPQRLRQSITYDNGSENTKHLEINRRLGTASYFCEPMRSWEKGSVENAAGLVRRRLPKKTDFATVTQKEIRKTERWLNRLPRKCLGFRTSEEAFREECCT